MFAFFLLAFASAQKDPCASLSCSNGGSCIASGGQAWCRCPQGFGGRTCAEKEDACTSSFCRNGGTCIASAGQAWCQCPQGFVGRTCADKQMPTITRIPEQDPCTSFQCYNGGTCMSSGSKAYCQCTQGFSGRMCTDCAASCASVRCGQGTECKLQDTTTTGGCPQPKCVETCPKPPRCNLPRESSDCKYEMTPNDKGCVVGCGKLVCPCVDAYDQTGGSSGLCANFKQMGACTSAWKSWMSRMCRKTCG
eukprot:143804_1